MQEYIRSKDYKPELIKDYYMKMAEECGELARAIRKNLRPSSGGQIKETIEEELWDIMYYVLAIANCYDIDLEQVIPQKEALNNQKYASGVSFQPPEKENVQRENPSALDGQ